MLAARILLQSFLDAGCPEGTAPPAPLMDDPAGLKTPEHAVPSTLIFGCGYLGRRVASLLIRRGDVAYGTTRGDQGARSLADLGIQPVIADVTRPETLADLPVVDRVLYCVGFDRGAGASIREVYVDGFRAALDRLLAANPRCPVVYAGSTGVFGGDDGDWVDEDSPVDPQTESGRACRDAEGLLAAADCPSIVLRLAGLYGPGRIMRREGLVRGEPVVGSPDKFLNFVQIDDAAAVAVRALDDVARGDRELFLVADGNPVTRAQFYGTAAELLGGPPPSFVAPEPGSPEAKREGSNKRINNHKLLARWPEAIRHSTIRSGLVASLRAEATAQPQPE